jgi:hypothetical protein
LKCIAFGVVNGKAVRCKNIDVDGSESVCSNRMCQRMCSKMLESDHRVIAALFDITDGDVDNTESEADELCGS